MKQWKDLGNGQWKLTISADGDPTAPPLSVFRGTKDEILDKLADSQIHANQRITQLRGNGNTPATPFPANPKPLTATERMETVADLQNPATVDKAVTRVIESVVGPVEELRRDQREDREDRRTRMAVQAAEQFAERTPEWYPSDHNKQTLVNYVKTQGLNPLDTNSYTRAFEALTAAQLLQDRPSESEQPPQPEAERERNAPDANAKPRTATRYSTSIRASDISGRPPAPSGKPHLKYTREQLRNLSAADYKRLMQTDRAELERCENHYAQQARRAS